MNDLDAIERRVEWLRDRLVSALAFTIAAAVASVLVSESRAFFVLVSMGACGWVWLESTRLRLAVFDLRSALDELVLAGSRDPRCERRRLDLRSARLQHRLARMLRQTCEQARCYAPSGALWGVDRQAVHAVERDLRELATVFEAGAGHLPPPAVALVHLLLASRFSPLYEVHPDTASERRAIQTTQRIIARCHAELDAPEHPVLVDAATTPGRHLRLGKATARVRQRGSHEH
jgi:hypothetical protein